MFIAMMIAGQQEGPVP